MGRIEEYLRKFKPLSERFAHIRLSEEDSMLTGIPAIDEATGGIMNSSFWVIGAATGSGKSHIGAIIAKNISATGKRVLFFALEAYDGEMEDRIKFNMLSKEFYENHTGYIRFKDWVRGKYFCDERIYEIEKKLIYKINPKTANNLLFRYPGANYTVEEFENEINLVEQYHQADMVIVDHLHYFNMPDSESENRAIKRIINKLRDIGIYHKIPIILISHLRKKDRNNKSLIASLEEFHGSSEITKNPTCVITITPAFDVETPEPYLFPTYFHIAKYRFDGGMKRYAMSSLFNIRTGEYEKGYYVYHTNSDGTNLEKMEKNKLPQWAISAQNDGYFSQNYGNKTY